MFRINRSKSDIESSPRLERKLDEKTLKDVSKSRSAITNMFESQGPKVTFGGNRPREPEPEKPKPKPKKQEPVSDNKKWVFDTIQKYFDVKVEEEQEEEEEDGDEEIEADVIPAIGIDEDEESDYTSAEEELPEQTPPPLVTKFPARKISISDKIDVASFFRKESSVGRSPATSRKTLSQERAQMSQITSRRASFSSDASDVILKHFGSPVPVQKPVQALPVLQKRPESPAGVLQRQLLNKMSQSPMITPKLSLPKRKVSIDDFVDDAAKQFDELTDGSDLSIDEVGQSSHVKGGNSCQNLNQLSKSNSSSKIRGLFSSVVHGSANDLNISKFKSNLLAHLSSTKTVSFGSAQTFNLDPGVGDDSSSDYSEYDD